LKTRNILLRSIVVGCTLITIVGCLNLSTNVKAEDTHNDYSEESYQKTVYLFGQIDEWGEGGHWYHLLYGGLFNGNISLVLQEKEASIKTTIVEYQEGMDIRLPRMILKNVVATESSITYEALYPQNRIQTPGFEIIVLISAVIIAGLVIKKKKTK
jgi:hypothetical protein